MDAALYVAVMVIFGLAFAGIVLWQTRSLFLDIYIGRHRRPNDELDAAIERHPAGRTRP